MSQKKRVVNPKVPALESILTPFVNRPRICPPKRSKTMIYLRQMIVVCLICVFIAHANAVSIPDFNQGIEPLIAKGCLHATRAATQHAWTAQQPTGSSIHRNGSVYPSLYPATPTRRVATPARWVGVQGRWFSSNTGDFRIHSRHVNSFR